MANSEKDIVVTPNRGSTTANPKIVFSGADASTVAQNITLQVYPQNSGTLSFEGSAGQLFSISNTLTGTIYSVNDISGIPSIEVLDTGLIKLGQYNGNVLIGTGTEVSGFKLQLNGNMLLGNKTGVSSASPITLSLGGSYSDTLGGKLKLKIYEDAAGNVSGFGASYGQIDYVAPNSISHVWYGNGIQRMMLDGNGVFSVGTSKPFQVNGASIYTNRNGNIKSGISFFDPSYTAWQIYMSDATRTNTGVSGTITAPSGVVVTSWGLRSFVENTVGYGWTWETASAFSTTPTIVAEMASSSGNFRTIGTIASSINANTSSQTDLYINPTTKTGNNLINCSINGSAKFLVDYLGNIQGATIYCPSYFTSNATRIVGFDFNAAGRGNGFYSVDQTGTNGPVGFNYANVIHMANGSDTGFQIAGGYTNDNLWFRGTSALQAGTGWTAWRKVWHDGNFNPASYQPADPDLTAIASLVGTSGYLRKTAADTWTLDTTTYTQNNDFGNVAVTTDSGYSWGTANANTTQTADTLSDTLTFVAGGGINLYSSTNAGFDAIKIEHVDTSTLATLTASARTYVTGLTFDTYGHVTALTTATESDQTTITGQAGSVSNALTFVSTNGDAINSTYNGSAPKSIGYGSVGAAPILHYHGLTNLNGNLSAPAVVDTLTNVNFRTKLFGNSASGAAISTARWDNVPTPFTGILSLYGTMIAWAAADTQAFLAVDYNSNGSKAIIGGGSSDGISWTREVATIGATTYARGSIDVISTDSAIRLKTTGGTADKNTWEMRSVPNTGIEYLQFRTINDAQTVFTTRMALWNSGGLYIGTTPFNPGAGYLGVTSGIKFGDAADTTLYRSAAAALTTNSSIATPKILLTDGAVTPNVYMVSNLLQQNVSATIGATLVLISLPSNGLCSVKFQIYCTSSGTGLYMASEIHCIKGGFVDPQWTEYGRLGDDVMTFSIDIDGGTGNLRLLGVNKDTNLQQIRTLATVLTVI